MNEYTLRMTLKDPDVQVKWKVRASSRNEAAGVSRRFFAARLAGVEPSPPQENGGGEAVELYGLCVLFLDPEEIDRRNVVDGPYDETDRCPGCGYAPVEIVGEPCRIAERAMPVQDYDGDVARAVPVGAHHAGWRCPACGEGNAEPCVHD